MSISIGEKIPEATFEIMGDDGTEDVSANEFFKGKKVALFALPGAFTPLCSANHLPGFLKLADTIRAKGVDEIAVVSVNDVWVMNEWAKASGGVGVIHFLADGAANFTRAVGMDEMKAKMGIRSKRYSMLVEDGIVISVNIEEAPGVVELSGAAAILAQL